MAVKVYCPKFAVTWAKDLSNNQVPAVIPTYYEIKKLATGAVILKQFDTQGGYFGANNHPDEFAQMFDAGDYEVTLRFLHRNRLVAQAFVMRGDIADSNSSTQMQVYKEMKAGMEFKFQFTVAEYNPSGTQYYKLNWNVWFENHSTHQFSTVNPTPPSSGDLGALTESQYYMQETFQISLDSGTLKWNNTDVPILDTSGLNQVVKRASLPNTATIEILNPNVNGGVAQQVTNPFYRNASGPSAPVVLVPTTGKMAIGGTISGSTTDYQATIVVFRNDVEIGTVSQTQAFGSNGSWSYKPTTPQVYKFKARKNSVDSEFSDAVQITIACNISNNQNILTWNVNGQYFRAKTFDGGISYYLCKIITESPLTLEVRGLNFLDRSDITAIGGLDLPALKACFANAETGTGGLDYDTNFITPAGYTKVGNTYVQNAAGVPAAPVPAANTGTVGNDISGTANQAGVLEVYKDGQKLVTNIVTSGGTNAWTYNPTQPGKYTFKLTNDNGTSPLSIEVNIAPVVDVTKRFFRPKGINYCSVNPQNIESGYSSTGLLADVTNWVDGIVIETTLLITPGTKGFIRDKTDHTKVSEGVLLIQ